MSVERNAPAATLNRVCGETRSCARSGLGHSPGDTGIAVVCSPRAVAVRPGSGLCGRFSARATAHVFPISLADYFHDRTQPGNRHCRSHCRTRCRSNTPGLVSFSDAPFFVPILESLTLFGTKMAFLVLRCTAPINETPAPHPFYRVFLPNSSGSVHLLLQFT